MNRRANPNPINTSSIRSGRWVEWACILGLLAVAASVVYLALGIVDNVRGFCRE